jgi:hypothetical protein
MPRGGVQPPRRSELARRALELSQEAEAIAEMGHDPDITRANVERYQRMLAAGISDETQKRMVQELLQDAEQMLVRVPADET